MPKVEEKKQNMKNMDSDGKKESKYEKKEETKKQRKKETKKVNKIERNKRRIRIKMAVS